jgi:hypothetical protein
MCTGGTTPCSQLWRQSCRRLLEARCWNLQDNVAHHHHNILTEQVSTSDSALDWLLHSHNVEDKQESDGCNWNVKCFSMNAVVATTCRQEVIVIYCLHLVMGCFKNTLCNFRSELLIWR